MDVFRKLFGANRSGDMPELLPAIERAVMRVEPMLKQAGGYPKHYRKAVATALDYVHGLAMSVPGPVVVSNEAYAQDAFVHAIFPSMESIADAFRSSRAMHEYRQKFPGKNEIYALMGMRRMGRNMMGMELSGQVIHREVPQQLIYFTSHTVENLASTEQHARELVAWSFFDRLVSLVAKRVETRKQQKETQLRDRDILMARLRAADAKSRPVLEAELARVLSNLQSMVEALELSHYLEDFEAVLMQPEQHLKLNQTEMVLDRMGVLKNHEGSSMEQPIVFSDLFGYDKRDWTVVMIYCRDMQSTSFASRLEEAYRRLSI